MDARRRLLSTIEALETCSLKGRYTRRSTLLQHAPGAKLPHLHQRFLAKKYVAQQNFCSRVLPSHIKLVSYEGASSRANLLHESVSGASSLVCTENSLP